MVFGAYAVEAEQLAGHLEAGHLIAPVFKQHIGLEEAAANGVNGIERFTGPIEVIAALDTAAGRHQIVKTLKFFYGQAKWQAQFAQVTIGARCLDERQRYLVIYRLCLRHLQPLFA
jgi:hypothetical protein